MYEVYWVLVKLLQQNSSCVKNKDWIINRGKKKSQKTNAFLRQDVLFQLEMKKKSLSVFLK